jgi:SAM-dependent methyltransferase
MARDMLLNSGIDGEVECADFHSPPKAMLKSFDVVVSFGVAEHFEDTASCIKTFSKFLRPGGIMITIIPNLAGLTGSIQKLLNRPVFDKHKLLNKEEMKKAHEAAGLKVSACDYFIFSNFGILNLNGIPPGTIELSTKRIFFELLTYLSYIIWSIESKVGFIRGNKTFSAYIVCRSSLPRNKKQMEETREGENHETSGMP